MNSVSILSKTIIAGFALGLCAVAAQAADSGATVYADNCAACHGEKGEGSEIAPPLQNTALWKTLGNSASKYFAAVVASGMSGKITVNGKTYKGVMPPQAHLSSEELAAVSTYVLKSINGTSASVSVELVDNAKQAPLPKAALHALRAGELASAR